MKTSTFAIVMCALLGGCIDTGDGLDKDDSVDTGDGLDDSLDTLEAALGQGHHDVHNFGGNIFSEQFYYVTQEGNPAGNCTPGFVRPSQPVVQWSSQGGGHCEFAGWNSGDPNDCRAIIAATTPGGWFGGTCQSWVYEVPAPTPNPSYSFNAANTNSAQMNTVNYAIVLGATQTLTVGTCGVTGASFSGDTYLRLYDPSGRLVASNDDSCGGLGSKNVYTSTVGGSFQIRAGCYSSSTCSGTVAWTIQ